MNLLHSKYLTITQEKEKIVPSSTIFSLSSHEIIHRMKVTQCMLVDLEKDVLMQGNQNYKDEIKDLQLLKMKASYFAQDQTAAPNTTLSSDIMKPRLISSIL